MSRQLKFRAWDKKENKWLFGYEYPNLGGFSLVGEVVLMGELSMLSLNKLCDDVVFMQYVGKKDKNGKEIYEDDVCRFKNADYIIVWSEQGMMFTPIMIKHTGHFLQAQDMDRCEVVGNRYQTPNLLKK